MVLQKIDVETGFFEMVGSTLSLHMSQVVYYVRAYLVETGPNHAGIVPLLWLDTNTRHDREDKYFSP
jgi:hypothetical protein